MVSNSHICDKTLFAGCMKPCCIVPSLRVIVANGWQINFNASNQSPLFQFQFIKVQLPYERRPLKLQTLIVGQTLTLLFNVVGSFINPPFKFLSKYSVVSEGQICAQPPLSLNNNTPATSFYHAKRDNCISFGHPVWLECPIVAEANCPCCCNLKASLIITINPRL